ncbi:hypothetical protein [Lampropedia aestuarii]|uniref:hypothetical protein n=1 Tax=Lampropedia aestuarii TaxID=2562762 RepID=UPI002468D69D|nr:hypothetical protein [Lampropedia aestuarii]MDH5859130.1 hypothetical protein [Lampropedia aestuarii]
MIDLQASALRTFIPAQDFSLSKEFYQALGGELEWSDAHLALFRFAGAHFYLQDYYIKEWAENCMMHITVQDAAASYSSMKALLASGRFAGARVAEPKREAYGASVSYVWDPSGVLLHLVQWDQPQ